MKTRAFTTMVILFWGVVLFAQNSNDAFRLSEPGIFSSAKSLGMGNALSTVGNDFSSIFLNPAGLGLFQNSEISFSAYNNNFSNDALYYGTSKKNSMDATNFSQIGIVYKMPVTRGSMVFAIGYNRIKDFNRIVEFTGFNFNNNSMIQDLTSKRSDFAYEAGVSYPVNSTTDATIFEGNLQQEGKTTDEGGINNWSIAFATELQKNLFIGGTINIISGRFERNREYYESDPYGYYSSTLTDPSDANTIGFSLFSYYDSIIWDISGWNMQLGFIYKLKDKVSLGASIAFPKRYNIKEDYTLSSYGDFQNITYESSVGTSSYEYTVLTPYEFSFGGSYNAGKFLVSADFKYIDYTQMEFTDGLTSLERSEINSSIKDNYRSVINYNFGAEYTVADLGLKLRAGFMMVKSPYEGDAAEYDKKFITGGLGFPLEDLELNFGFCYGWWKDYGYNYDSATTPVYQDLKSTTIMASLKYIFE